MRLKGKIALITGSSKGIGRAVAIGFAKEGANLFLTAKDDRQGLEATLEEVRSLGVRGEGGPYDAANFKDVEKLMDDIERTYGALDVLVNNAGIINPAPFWELHPEQFEKTVRTHLFGTYYHTWTATKRFMIPKSSGKVVNLAAPAAFRGFFGVVDYASAKGGIVAFTKNVAHELVPYNIQVKAVVPVAETRMTDALSDFYADRFGAAEGKRLQNLPKAERLVGTFVYFASPDSDYVTGQVVAADGGMY